MVSWFITVDQFHGYEPAVPNHESFYSKQKRTISQILSSINKFNSTNTW